MVNLLSTIQCDVIMRNLQCKPKMDGVTLKNFSDQETFI